MAEVFESMFPRNKECRSIIEGCISNCRRLVGTPAGAARRGRCLHRPHEAKQCDNLKCTHAVIYVMQSGNALP